MFIKHVSSNQLILKSVKLVVTMPFFFSQVCIGTRAIPAALDLHWLKKILYLQRRNKNAEKVTHIKGRLLDQAMILFSCVPFQMGTSLKGKNLLPEGANSFLYEQFLILWKITFITLSDLFWILLVFITHVRNLRTGCFANDPGTLSELCRVSNYQQRWYQHQNLSIMDIGARNEQ